MLNQELIKIWHQNCVQTVLYIMMSFVFFPFSFIYAGIFKFIFFCSILTWQERAWKGFKNPESAPPPPPGRIFLPSPGLGRMAKQVQVLCEIIFQLEKQIQLWMKFYGFHNVSINRTFGKGRLKKHNKVKLMQTKKNN